MVEVVAQPKQREKDPSLVASGRLHLRQNDRSTIVEIFLLAFAGDDCLQLIDRSPWSCVLRTSPTAATHAAEAPLFCRRVVATAAPAGSCEYRDKHRYR